MRVNALRAKATQARAETRDQVEAGALPERVPAPSIPNSLCRRGMELERGEQLIRKAVPPFYTHQDSHHAWLDAMRLVSPMIALQYGLERLAGANTGRALAFQQQAPGFLHDVRVLVKS